MAFDYLELLDLEINYKVISRLFGEEIDQAAADWLLSLGLDDFCDEPLIRRGAQIIHEELTKELPDNYLDLLAAEYAAAFIGTAGSKAAYPYESVYTSPQQLVMQKAFEDVRNILNAHGVFNDSKLYDDHIAIELQYLAYLVEKLRNTEENSPEYEPLIEDQESFLDDHIHNLVPKFTSKIKASVRSRFYLGAAMMLAGAVREHDRILRNHRLG
ncbi:TorD/DmsD family molecular chaperone [Parasutterella muris]|uniref:Molecular chaperone TorD n=1 Tax=Parasutterella muris TaxID=2565572 RepID=A0A6L6YL30_9BURK|nr:molecular chaperone TorD family protein [Parasutterella muris]MVX57479.1 hypothetical protein [Parasutterella muris]